MVAQRQLIVVVSLDVSGFTRLVQDNERATLVELAAIRRDLLLGTLGRRNGRLFKTMGDGALIEFTNVADAVTWTVEFQEAMQVRNQHRPGTALQVRAGIALADAFLEGDDRFGAGIAFVVRLQEAAPPGGILLTHSVRWQLGKALLPRFRKIFRTLKSIDESMEMWVWDPAQPLVGENEASPPTPAETAASSRPSIVVLRFDNLAGDPTLDPFIDGVVEEVTATLSRVRDFTVIARNSAYAYRTRPVDFREVSRLFGTRYVLQGSVRTAGRLVRVTAQLIDAVEGAHLWSERYEGELADVFDLEDRIAVGVAGALRPSIRTAEITLAQRRRPETLKSYDLVMQAMPHLWAHRRSRNAAAIALLTQALSLDPNYGRAAAFAAWAHAQQVCYNWTADHEGERAEGQRLVDVASEIVGDDPTALTALSSGIMLLFADLDRARLFIDRALALDPNHAWAWTRLGFVNTYAGDPATGKSCFERGIQLSPLDPLSFNCTIGLGLAAFAAGQPREAALWTTRAIAQKPGVTWMFRDLATFLAHAGDLEGAARALSRFAAPRPDLTLGDVADSLSFMEDQLRDRYVEGLRLAGLRSERRSGAAEPLRRTDGPVEAGQ